jgi:hypothetical protein
MVAPRALTLKSLRGLAGWPGSFRSTTLNPKLPDFPPIGQTAKKPFLFPFPLKRGREKKGICF